MARNIKKHSKQAKLDVSKTKESNAPKQTAASKTKAAPHAGDPQEPKAAKKPAVKPPCASASQSAADSKAGETKAATAALARSVSQTGLGFAATPPSGPPPPTTRDAQAPRTGGGADYGGTCADGVHCDPSLSTLAAIRQNGPDYGAICADGLHCDRPHSTPVATRQIGCIVTCHNYGRYLGECLDSCLEQTVPFTTIVVVDDASTDNTALVARKYVAHGSSRAQRPVIAYARVDCRDTGQARNAGYAKLLSLAPNTTHVIFVDADNALTPECVAAFLPKFGDMRVGVAYGNLLCFGERSGMNPNIKPWSPRGLDQYNIVDTCALVRREALDHSGGWVGNMPRMEDWLLWSRMAANGWRFVFTPEATVRYRIHRGQKSDYIERDMEVVRGAWRIAIMTLFSGRWWSLDRYAETLRSVDWPRENLFVVAVDNSASASFGAALRDLLGRSGITHVIVPCHATIDGTPGALFSDDAAKRTHHSYRFNTHVGRLWATGRQFLPTWATHVWTLEDDIEPPPATLNKLAEALWMNRRAQMATGFARSRFDHNWMVFRNGDRLAPTSALMEVERTGCYCALWRRPAFDNAVFAPSHALMTVARGYYDWMACDSARLDGGKILGVGGVVCKHWKADGTYL